MTKKHVSLLVVFVLLFTTLFSGFVFAADETEWVVADEITINVDAHIQTFADQSYTGQGEVAFGTEGKAKRLERFDITLEGAPEDMELVGMAHVQSYGDMPKTGFQAGAIGTSGEAKRIEGVAFKLVKKGTDTLYPGYRVAYAVHMQSFGWGISDKVNEVVGKNFDGAEDFAYDGQFAGTRGLYKRIESVSLIIYKEAKLAVKEVSALNLKQVAVEFNNASQLDEKATKIDNYALEDADGKEIELAGAELDGNVVVLTIEDGDEVDNQTDATLTVKKAILGEDKEFEVEFVDLTIPKVLGAKVIGEDTVKVYFSEPIKVADENDFEIDNGDYFIKDIEFVKNRTEINVTTYSSFDEGTIKIEVGSGIEDFAGLNVLSKTFTVEVPNDKTPPAVVGYKDASRTAVTLIFDEDILLTNEADIDSFYHTNTSNTVDTNEDGDPDVEVNGAELTLNFGDSPLPEGTAYVYIQGKVIADLFGNVEKNVIRTKVEVTVDTVKPEVKKVEAVDQDTIKVTFTEDVIANSAENEDNYLILDSEGKEVEDIIDDAELTDDDVVTLTLDEDLDYGDYTLVVENVQDLAGNKLAKTSVKFTVGDEDEPDFPEKATLYVIDADDDEYKLVIKFDEPMAVEGKYSVIDLDNYILGDDYLSDIAEEDDVTVTIKAIDKNKTVEILIKGYEVNTTMKIVMARVADAAGNKTVDLKSPEIPIYKAAKIGFKDVEAIATDKIRVKFDNSFDKFYGSDLAVIYGEEFNEDEISDDYEDKIEISRIKQVASDEVELTLSFDDDEKLDYVGKYKGEDVYVVVNGSPKSVNKQYNLTLEAGAYKKVDDKIAPAVDYIAADLDDKIVAIYFEENIAEDTVSRLTFEVEDCTVVNVKVDGHIVYLKVKDTDEIDDDAKVTQKSAIEDEHSNKVTGIVKEVEEIENLSWSAEDEPY